VPRLALAAAVVAAAVALAAPAYGEGSVQFTLGRVVHTTPDSHGRIGIRSSCADAGGCKVDYTLARGTTMLGGTQALLLEGTVQTDYVTLTKATAASLRKRRMRVTISAAASDPDGNEVTLTKLVTLGPKTKRR
jgi:hypothetical protein